MANTVAVSFQFSPNYSEKLQKLNVFYHRFLEIYEDLIRESELRSRDTIYGQPHDALVAITKKSIIFITSKGTATDAMSTERYYELSEEEDVTAFALKREAAEEFGWNEMYEIEFGSALIEESEENQKKAFRVELEKILSAMLRKKRLFETLGIKEASLYLDNARKRFEAGGDAGFSDCKGNCRNAIASIVKALSGTDKIRDGVRILHTRGIMGEREGEVIEGIGNLIALLYGMASKKGAHPPLAEENDALLTLRLTEAVFDYLVNLAEKVIKS